MKIELTPEQIADAVFEGDYPDHAKRFDAIGAWIKNEAENDDKYYRWTRYLIDNMGDDGIRFIRDMSTALEDSEL